MTAEAVSYTEVELDEWREAVLSKVNMTGEELEAREAAGALSEDEANALTTIRGIDFLKS